MIIWQQTQQAKVNCCKSTNVYTQSINVKKDLTFGQANQEQKTNVLIQTTKVLVQLLDESVLDHSHRIIIIQINGLIDVA